MPSDEEAQEFIVVKDGQPRINTNGIGSSSTPISLENSPATGRDQSASRPRPGDSLDALRALPVLREIPWYEGKELPLEKAIESIRVQTRGACLLATRGQVQNPPCNHCATGVGRFSQCISSEDWFHGACATCQLATRGNLCSLRKKDTLRIKKENKSNKQEMDALNSIPRRNSSLGMDESNMETRSQPQLLPALRPHAVEDTELSSKKRKRETLQGTSVWKPYVSPYLPAMPSNSIQPSLPSTPTLYSSPNTTYPSQNTGPPLLNYIYRKENHTNGTKSPPLPSAKTPNPKAMRVQINESSSRHQDFEKDLNGTSRGREATDSLSPSAQLLQHFGEPEVEERWPQVQGFVAINAEKTVPKKPVPPPDPPLIDTLPRKKQKQIYGMIGGLQSGIRNCKQQADSMQQQLDLLQAALGIDIETDDDECIPER